MPQTVKSQLIHGVAWNFMEKVLMRGAGFVIGIVLARLLSPSDFGLLGMLAIFISISNNFIEGGFAKALIQRQDCSDIDFSTAFVSNVGMALFIYAILFVSAPLIADFYDEPILTPLTRVLALNFILGAFNIVQRAKLMAVVDFRSLAQINVVSVILSGAVGIGMAYSGYGVWSLVGQTLFSTIVLVILFPIYSRWKPSFCFSKASFRRLFGFGSKLMLTGTVAIIVNNISTLFIGKFYKSNELGFFTRAVQFPDLVSSTFSDVLGNVTFPILSELQDDREKMLFVYKRSLYYTVLLVFPIMILLTLLSRPLVIILLTEKWLPCVLLMQWLFMARLFTPISSINLNILNAIGRSDLFMKVDFSKLPMNIIMLIITIPIGVHAIVIGMFCCSFIAFFINAYYPAKLFGYGSLRQLKDWKYIILSCIIMAFSIIVVKQVSQNVWFQLIVGSLTGLVTFVLCCYMFRIVDAELIIMVKKKINK